jgi:CheY-like chemotaxis protein
MNLSWKIKIPIAAFLVILAILRVIFHDKLNAKMDNTFLLLLAFAFFVLVLPWEHLKTFKAGGVEITLEKPEVQAAISGLGLDRVDDAKLRQQLSKLKDELKIVSGSRVIWIDDKPHNILGARRMLRALNIDVTTAISSEIAQEILNTDNDFDLIISDVQRNGESYKQVEGGIKIHEGVNFIVVLRRHTDPNIRMMPVIFYAAYDWERLVKFTRPARELIPEAEISNSMDGFLPKVIRRLAEERSEPIAFSKVKKPTAVD